jgi:hypothetical protein
MTFTIKRHRKSSSVNCSYFYGNLGKNLESGFKIFHLLIVPLENLEAHCLDAYLEYHLL